MERLTQKIVRLLTSQKISGESDEGFFNRIYYSLVNPDYSQSGLEINRNVSRFWAGSFLNQYWGSGYITNNKLSVPLSSMPQGIKNIIADDSGYINNSGGAFAEADSIIKNAFDYERNRTAEMLAAEAAEAARIAQLDYENRKAAEAAAALLEKQRIEQAAAAAAQAREEAERLALIAEAEKRNLVTVDQQNTINVYEILSQNQSDIEKKSDVILQVKEGISTATGIPANEIPVTIQEGNIVTTESILSVLHQGIGSGTVSMTSEAEALKGKNTEFAEDLKQPSADYTPILLGAGLWILKKFF